jgi:hypothetical protein
MSYLLLIVEPQGQRRERSPAEGRDRFQSMVAYAERLKAEGVLLATQALREEAVRYTLNGGKPKLTDGPFTEAKELIGGFCLLNCATREEALHYAAECPAAAWASIEVREIGICYE